jgi:hypothetical protein
MADRPRTVPERRPGEPLVDAARREAIDAVYYERDHGGTMHTAGAAAADAVLALLAPVDDHLVDVDEHSFTVTHPLTERADGRMHLCDLHQWLRGQDGPPVPPGLYRATPHQPDAYSEPLGADAWELEPVDERTRTAAS